MFRHTVIGLKNGNTKLSKYTEYITKATYSVSADPNETYLHQSRVPTDHFQPSLPRLPIPKLEETCNRYLSSQQPILSSDEFSNTAKLVDEFQKGVGYDLHDELVALDKKNKHTSYIGAPWFDMYIKDRRPVALNHNPFMSFKDDERPGYNDQLIRATNFIYSSMRFKNTLEKNILEPEVYHLNPKLSNNDKFRNFVRWLPSSLSWYGAYWYKVFPLDMSQFPRLMNSTRIPRKGQDELYTDDKARHVLVLRKGHFYTLTVYNEDGTMVPAAQIHAGLKSILESQAEPSKFPLGVMTTQDRDSWTDIRSSLEESGNMEALKAIDGAMFALALDEEAPEDPTELSRLFLHSNGTNRWFDKSFTLIMTGNGKTCVNFEHSWGDGVAVLRYFNEVYADTTNKAKVSPTDTPDMSGVDLVKKLEFNMSDDVKEAIVSARSSFAEKIASLDLSFIQYDKFGKNFIKQQKFSPDAFMQFAIQLAYYRHSGGKTAATYESCSTAAFRHGRTETIRPCTNETKLACELFESSDIKSPGELRAALDACSMKHSILTRDAAMGNGFDRHLFAMRALAAARNEVPEIFQDPAYAKINHVILSTSTLSSPALLIGGFGPVVKDGLGIGYGVEDEQLGCIVTSYPPHGDVHGFLSCMQQTFTDMNLVFSGKSFK